MVMSRCQTLPADCLAMEDDRFDAPLAGDDYDPDDRLPRLWHITVLEQDGSERVVLVPTSVLQRIRRQTDGSTAYFVRRALLELAIRLEEEAARFVPGSSAPPVQPFRPARVENPVSMDEVRGLAGLLRQSTSVAVHNARRAYGEPTVPARASQAPTARPEVAAELVALAGRLDTAKPR
jgi:hypothetical protein